MEPRGASRTAVMVAAYRARATRGPDALCSDPWAAGLAGDEGDELARRLEESQPFVALWVALRTGFLDERIARWTRPNGDATQVVMLGAGLDTRAARLARDGVRFFEVDQPSSQADKRARLERIDGYPVDAATYVRCDFERDDFLERLAEGGFESGAPAVIVWEGVTPYLTEQAVRATLRRVATGCHPRSVLLFDFLGSKIALGNVRHQEDVQTRELVEELGEPLRWGTNDALPMLYEEGFRKARVTSFDEIALNRTGTYERVRKWRFQSIAECSVVAEAGT